MYLILLAVLLRSGSAILAKQAGLAAAGAGLRGMLLNPWLLGEFAALFGATLVWVQVLRRYSLSFAYPFLSLVYALNLLAAWALFKEHVTIQHVIGIAVLMIGVAVMAPQKVS